METRDVYTNNLIDKFCEAMATGLVNRSKEPAVDVWPQPVFNPLIGNYFAYREVFYQLYRIFHALEIKNFNINDIASLFSYPSRTAHLMYLFMEDSSDKNEASIKTTVAHKLLEIISILRNETPFCEDGKNAVWNRNKINQAFSKVNLVKLDDLPNPPLIRKLISKSIVALSGYCEFLYFANIAFGREFHGPYGTPYGKLLMREYFDLKPSFWRFTKNFPFEKIMLFTIYPIDIDVRFDFAGRLYANETLGPKLMYISIIVDEKEVPLEIDTLQHLLSSINNFIEKAIQEVSQMNKYDLISKWVEAYFWVLRPFRNILGEDWKPPEELYLRIKKEKTDTWLIYVMKNIAKFPPSIRLHIMRKVFDPRLLNKKTEIDDWYPR